MKVPAAPDGVAIALHGGAGRHGGVAVSPLAAGHPAVRSAAALAPCVYPNDVPSGIDGKSLLIVHGTDDRVASQAWSAALARTLDRTADVTYESVVGGRHAMLRHHARFDGAAVRFAVATLLDRTLIPASATHSERPHASSCARRYERATELERAAVSRPGPQVASAALGAFSSL